jgi:hypothetical protein
VNDQAQARPQGGATTLVFPDLPKALSHACPEPLIPVGEPRPDEPVRPSEPPEDEPQA